MHWLWLVAGVWLLAWLNSCSSPPATDLLAPWVFTDLRALDPADAAAPQQDLIAVYLRQDEQSLQIRLDLLETDRFDEFDLYLAIDSGPGGTKALPLDGAARIDWDTLIRIPAHASISIVSAQGAERLGSAVFVVRDPDKQALLIRVERKALRAGLEGWKTASPLKLQVFLTPAGQSALADQSAVISQADPPPPPAQALIAFWNVFPAYTPGIALRRWDGAHTGPNGGRHGLYNLLRTAQSAQIPLVLLDLNEPVALSALDYAGKLEWVKSLQQDGLLALPIALPEASNLPIQLNSSLVERLSEWEAQTAEGFGLMVSDFSYAPPGSLASQANYGRVFLREPPAQVPSSDSNAPESYPPLKPIRRGEKLIFPLYEYASRSEAGMQIPPVQAERDGLALDWKRALLTNALTQAGYLNLGGELPGSTWGDPQWARASFHWLNEHPWVRVLSAQDLPAMPPAGSASLMLAQGQPATPDRSRSSEALAIALQTAPANSLGQAAWQTFQALYAPVYPAPEQLPAMRANYIGQVWSLLEAARWAAAPAARTSCTGDPDRDGQPECVMATDTVYAQFEIGDASLTWLFAFPEDDTGQYSIHELVGPSAQSISGLSEPATWGLEAGLNSDPSVIPGAFAGPGEGYAVNLSADKLIFEQSGEAGRKIYELRPAGIVVTYFLPPSAAYPDAQIPLMLDPWRRFTPGWAGQYRQSQAPGIFEWGLRDGPTLRVETAAGMQAANFLDSQGLFPAPEDPNHENPAGHFLPFPLALVRVQSRAQFMVIVQLRKPGG